MTSSISTPSSQKVSEPLMTEVREWFLGQRDIESSLRPHLDYLCKHTLNLNTLLTFLYSNNHIELESLQKFERLTPCECCSSLYVQFIQKNSKSHLNILLMAWEGSGNHHLVRYLYKEICGVDVSAENPGGGGGPEESALQQLGSTICQQRDLEQQGSDHNNTTQGQDSVNSRTPAQAEIDPLLVQKEKKNQKRPFQWFRRKCSFRVVVAALLALAVVCIGLTSYIIHLHRNIAGSTSTEQPDRGATWSNLLWMTPMPTVARVTTTTPVTSSIPPEVTITPITSGVAVTPATSPSSNRVTEAPMEPRMPVTPVTSSSTPDVTQMPDRLGVTPTLPPSTQAQETDMATEAELTMADTGATSVTIDPPNTANVDNIWTTHPMLPTTQPDSGPLVITTTTQLLKLRADDVHSNSILVQFKYFQVSNFLTTFNSTTDEKIGRVQNLYFTGPISKPLLEYLHQKFYRVDSFVIDVVPLCSSRSKLLGRKGRTGHEKNFENIEAISTVRYLGLSRCRPCEAYSMLLGQRIDQLEHFELLHCDLTAEVWGPVHGFLGRHNDVLRNLTLCKSSLCDSCTFSDIPFHHKVGYMLTDSC